MNRKISRPGGSLHGSAEVVSIAARGAGRHVSAQVAAARDRMDMTPAALAEYLTSATGRTVRPEHVENWESGRSVPPGDILWTCLVVTDGAPADSPPLLHSVPGSFPASRLTGPWVTVYQFAHAGRPHYHADIAHVLAEDDLIRAENHPPQPRTQGRSSPFLNEIEGRLFGRHVIGTWRNTSDTRYYGALQLAVLPGETVMSGYYTGLASDIEVSAEPWRWVRLAGGDASGLHLREPTEIYELVMTRTQDDPPLTAADIGENA